ncbi:multicopper oxidase family protein [Tunturibacter empetritectus]|uniref:Multicopper oxidase family protein n=1 Tax=Tunturiibacter empetritectus TaxID=3069691 RepID=A0AAU7ZHX4_9BACT
MAAVAAAMPDSVEALGEADARIDIAAYSLEVASGHFIKTVAYNQQVPGALLRLKEGRPVTIDVANHTNSDEIVHWHGLFLPPEVDGAMEEGTPHIAPGGSARYTFTPSPAGFRWYHTHTFAGRDLKKAQYTGQHGFLIIEPRDNPARYDQEIFLALHDWSGSLLASDDGSMNPAYDISTINGRKLGFGESLRVKQGERVLLHVLNSSATEPHWIAFAGHSFRVIALDGNTVPQPRTVAMLRLAPAERVCAVVEMNNPGVWVMGEVRKHVMGAGMGVVVEYAGAGGKPRWEQPNNLVWDYPQFGVAGAVSEKDAVEIPLVFESKFAGHGAMDRFTINGKSFPDTETVVLTRGQRYRLLFKNKSTEDHPVHLHRHTFELIRVGDQAKTRGILKDVVLVGAGSEVDVEFTANHPGLTLFHCHQQNHMDDGFMMLFRYM